MSVELIARSHKSRFLEWLDSDESSRDFISRSVHFYDGNDALFEQLILMTRQHDFYAWVIQQTLFAKSFQVK